MAWTPTLTVQKKKKLTKWVPITDSAKAQEVVKQANSGSREAQPPTSLPSPNRSQPIDFSRLSMSRPLERGGETMNRPIDFGRISGVNKPPTFYKDTVLTAGKPSPVHQLVSKLPEKWQAPVENVVADLHDALFGRTYATTGSQPLHQGGFFDYIGRTNTDKVEHLAQKLEDKGTPKERAAAIAFYDVFSKGISADPESMALRNEAQKRLSELQPNSSERTAMFLAHAGQSAGVALDIANVLPGGEGLGKGLPLAKKVRDIISGVKKANPSVDIAAAIKYARTIAQKTGSKTVEAPHILEGLQYATPEAAKSLNTIETAQLFSSGDASHLRAKDIGVKGLDPQFSELIKAIREKAKQIPKKDRDLVERIIDLKVGKSLTSDSLRTVDEFLTEAVQKSEGKMESRHILDAAQKLSKEDAPMKIVTQAWTKGEKEKAVKLLVENAKKYDPDFKKSVDVIAKRIGATAEHGPVKTPERLLEKATNEGVAPETMRDTNRSTLLVDSPEEMQKVLDSIKIDMQVSRVKDKFNYPGYKSAIVNVKTPLGHEAEIAVTTPEMWKAKMSLGGDKMYKEIRIKSADWQTIEKKMNDLYSEADAALSKRLRPSSAESSLPSDSALAGGNTPPTEVTPKTSSVSGSKSTFTTSESSISKKRGNLMDSSISEKPSTEPGGSQAAPGTTAKPTGGKKGAGQEGAAPPGKPPAKQGSEKAPEGNNASPESYSKIKEIFTNVVEYVQNESERLRLLTAKPGMDLAADPYQTMTLYHGRVGQKIQEGYDAAHEIAGDLVSYAGRGKATLKAGRDELSKYLQALHAPERNAALGEGAAGITTEEAAKVVADTPASIKAIAQKALDLNKKTLQLLKDSGVITDELFDTLTTKYKNHVPLQRVMDESEDIGSVLSGKGFDVKSTGVKRAVGSDKKVADILTNIVMNYEQAVLRSEKNIVDNATLAFVRNNAKDLEHLMAVQKPRAVGKTFDGIPMMERTNDPTIVQLFEKGKPIWIKVKDEKLAIALRGVGREKLGGLLSAVGKFTRFYSGLATRFNPEFALPNKIRDLQETITYLAAQQDVGFRGAAGMLGKDTTIGIVSSLLGKETGDAKLYKQLRELGGTTGGMGLSTRAQVDLNLDAIFAGARSRPRQTMQKIVQYVDNWNTIFEDSTRLSVFKQALAQGLSPERAAFLAKEASINFNRSGKGGPVINALWMFANASIQGSAKMVRAMKDPKVAAAVTASVGGSVAAITEWNNKVDPDWRDKVTKWDRMNGLPFMVPTHDGSAKYVVIPVSWGLKPILVMSNAVADALDGKGKEVSRVMGDLLSSIVDAYNPVGGTDVASAISPTIADAPVEIARNQSWSGSKIRPDTDANAPRDIQYFSSLADNEQGRLSIEATKKLREGTGILMSPADLSYVIDQYVGGAGRSIEKTSNLLYGMSTKEVPPPDEWPFVSRFLRMRSQEEVGQGAGGDIERLKESLSDQSRAKFELAQEADQTYQTFKSLPKETAAAKFNALKVTDPALAAKIKSLAEADALNLNYKERLVKALNIGNGERARYLADIFNALESKEEKAKLWNEYKQKKLITDEVARQLRDLIKSSPTGTPSTSPEPL